MPESIHPEPQQARLDDALRELEEVRRALRASEAARRESQDYFAKSFFSSPAVMAIADATDGRVIEVNSSFLESTGLTRDEIIGRNTLEAGLWVSRERRDEFLSVIKSTGGARDFEAQFRTRAGLVRDVLLTADIIEAHGQPCMLTVAIDITERRRRQRVQEATYQISRLLLAGGDLTQLFAELHRIIGTLMPARNFYVALLTPDRSLLTFPYFVDETMAPPAPRPPGFGLTEYVLDTRAPFLATPEALDEIAQRGLRYVQIGTPAALWLGAPLIINDRAVGVIAVQDYGDPRAFGEEEKRLLAFVAEQAALAVQKHEADEARRESQEYFAKSFHASPALMALASLSDGRILEANDAFLKVSGFSRSEVLGRTAVGLGIWPRPEDRDVFIRQLRESGFVRDHEAVFHTKTRDARFVSLNADQFDLEGRPCMLITAIDLTERHRREKVQAATYQIAQAVLAGGSLDALFAELHRIIGTLMPARNFYVALLSPDGSLLSFPYFVDEQFPEAPPRAPSNGFTEHILRTGRPALVTAAELEAILSVNGPYQHLDRPAAQRLGAPLLINDRAIGVISVQDYGNSRAFGDEELRLLTFVAGQAALAVQRRQIADALERAERQFRELFENAPQGLYQTLPNGHFLRANRALARMFGYASPAELISAVNDLGRQSYVDPGRRAQFLELARTSDSISDFESEVERPDGTRIWISESVRVARNAAREASHIEGVAVDVTAQHEAARVLRKAKETADEANRAKSQFLASMSHELRTPLNGILGYTQILRRDSSLGGRQRDGVEIIHQSAEHLFALINDVLDLAKIEARKLELNPVELDLPEFAQSVADFFAPRAREKNLLLETAFAADLPRLVLADPQRLRQVVFNLMSNAVKFTAQGGVVFSIERVASRLRFSVSDSGPGIAEEDLPRLFEPFAQVGNLEQRTTGTGLGLNVSRSILEQMGAGLQVESRAGWGTRFWFDLELPEVAVASGGSRAPLARHLAGYEGPRLRVLAADDHAPNRSLIVDLLTPLGFDVVTAVDGQEAVDMACERKPDLILMDLRMPRMDGLAAARSIRSFYGENRPCIIGISASAQGAQRESALEAGCAAFLSKPFREEDLFALMERQLGIRWIEADAAGGETSAPFPQLPHPPDPADAVMLHELACKGDILALRSRVDEMVRRDPRLAPFAQNITSLASRFRMKAIRQFVSLYLPEKPAR